MADETQEWSEVEYHEFPERKINFDETPSVEGILLWRETVPAQGLDGNIRDATMYAFVDANGEEFGVWGTANLDPQMRRVSDGEMCRIEYLEEKKLPGGKKMRKFRVFRKPAV